MKKNLREVANLMGFSVGCGDNSCIWGRPGGMATNGGCRCRDSKGGSTQMELGRMKLVAQHLLDTLNMIEFVKDDQK